MISRQEFENTLTILFKWSHHLPLDSAIESWIMQDKDKLNYCRSVVSRYKEKVKLYLDQWDNAKTDEERQNIIGSVKITIENMPEKANDNPGSYRPGNA